MEVSKVTHNIFQSLKPEREHSGLGQTPKHTPEERNAPKYFPFEELDSCHI